MCYLLKRARESVLSIEYVLRICGCLVGNRIGEENGSPMEWWCDGMCGTGIRREKENKEKHYVWYQNSHNEFFFSAVVLSSAIRL